MRREDRCRGETARVVVGCEPLTSELFDVDAAAAAKLRELRR